MPVALRIPETTKKRASRLAKLQDKSVHAFMIEAIEEKVHAEEAQATFRAEAEARLAELNRTGMAIPANEVFDYLTKRAAGVKANRPRPRKVP